MSEPIFRAFCNDRKKFLHEGEFTIWSDGSIYSHGDLDGHTHPYNAVLCRSTGKYFKDDLQLYENDILKSLHFIEGNKKHYMYHVVKWSNIYSNWMAINCENYGKEDSDSDKWENGNLPLWVYFDTALEYEICGNVLDNPELLEQK